MVHHGFLQSWVADNLQTKVVDYVLEAVDQCREQSQSDQPVTVFVTGTHLTCLLMDPPPPTGVVG